MHNWRLLLLAFLAVLQPIASFTDRNLVDGREQCCDRNSLLRDTRLTYGTFRLNKLPEDRRLSRSESREDRRYEVRKADVFTRPSADRRLVEFRSEREVRNRLSYEPARFYRTEFRRESVTERREHFSRGSEGPERRDRDDNRISFRSFSRDLYDRDTAGIRLSRHTDVRQQDRDNKAFVTRESRDQSRRTRSLDGEKSRITEFRREVQRNRDSTGEFSRIQEARETRYILQRARPDIARNAISDNREDRRVVRERTEERRERQSLDRRTRVMVDNRRESLRSMSEGRVLNSREETRLNQRDTRVERQNRNHFRREVERRDHLRLQRNDERISRIRISDRRDLRERSAEERRNTRQSTERLQNAERRSTRLERVDNRRDARLDERRMQARSRDETRTFESRRTETRRMLHREAARYRDVAQERRERRTVERFEVRDSKHDQRMNVAYRIAKADNQRSESRFRSIDLSRTREISAAVREKNQSNEENSILNWQYIMYTLQALYICHALMQMLSPAKSKQTKSLVWWSAAPSPIKVD